MQLGLHTVAARGQQQNEPQTSKGCNGPGQRSRKRAGGARRRRENNPPTPPHTGRTGYSCAPILTPHCTHDFNESRIRETTRLGTECRAVNLAKGFPNFPCPEILKE